MTILGAQKRVVGNGCLTLSSSRTGLKEGTGSCGVVEIVSLIVRYT